MYRKTSFSYQLIMFKRLYFEFSLCNHSLSTFQLFVFFVLTMSSHFTIFFSNSYPIAEKSVSSTNPKALTSFCCFVFKYFQKRWDGLKKIICRAALHETKLEWVSKVRGVEIDDFAVTLQFTFTKQNTVN